MEYNSNAEVLGYEEDISEVRILSPTESDASSTIYSTCQSNDSDGELGVVSDHSVNDDPINDHIPIPSIEQNWNQRMERDLGGGYSFERKPCFVCGNLSHLIKDCDFMRRRWQGSALKSKKMVLMLWFSSATPVWTSTLTGVNVNTGHGNVSTVSSAGTQIKSGSSRFNTGKQHVNSGSVHVNSGTQIKSGSSRFNTGKQHVNSGGQNWDTAVKTSAGCVWRKVIPLSYTNSGPTPDSNVNVSRGPQGRPKPVKAWVTRINWRILKNSIGDLLPLEGRIDIGDINTDAEITLIDETQGRINDIIADEDITLIKKLLMKKLDD
ncbi:hypothetical protein Tco_1375694 [Tanacetum coccineum]